MVGSIGRGAGIGALSNGVSNMCVTTIDYLAEHGNLNGALDDIAMSGFSGIVSDLIAHPKPLKVGKARMIIQV